MLKSFIIKVDNNIMEGDRGARNRKIAGRMGTGGWSREGGKPYSHNFSKRAHFNWASAILDSYSGKDWEERRKCISGSRSEAECKPLSSLIQHGGKCTQSQANTDNSHAHGKCLHCRLNFQGGGNQEKSKRILQHFVIFCTRNKHKEAGTKEGGR